MEQPRPPIVTILGHVDHGKTTLLDFIRKSTVAAKEHGGITQHIGAYQITSNSNLITFIDTPGHAAFEKMRSRGAKVADIAVLVVAIDDTVMPQTVEAVKHIKEAKVPLIVAVNKVDLPGVNIKVQLEKIKKQLSDQQILVEEYGGDVPIVPLSAKTGEGVDKLLEMVLLVAEINELKADPGLPPSGVVIEANLDKFKGPIATLLITNGTLKKGMEIFLAGIKGKVRGMIDFNGKAIESAGPSTPVEVLGFSAVPLVGARLGDEAEQPKTSQEKAKSLIEKLKQDKLATLNVIIKADKQGSLEAIEASLQKFNMEAEHVKAISVGTGEITEADIKLACATRSIVIGFNTKMNPAAKKLSETEHVLVRSYNIIYELLEELEVVVEEMLKVGAIEEVFGTAQILAEFPFGKNERIAGSKLLDGYIAKGQKIRVVRGDQVLGETRIKSLKKGKEESSRVEKGVECGFLFDPKIDFQIGDLVQSFRTL